MRDLDQLSVIGVPLYTVQGKGGGYRVLDSISLPPISFSEDELKSILFACHMLDLMGENPFRVEVQAVREKLIRQMPEYVRERAAELTEHLDWMTPRRTEVLEHLRGLYLASLSRAAVRLSYAAKTGEEGVECFPIGVYAWEGFWYGVGYVPRADGYRIFRADRVLRMELLEDRCAPEGLWTLAEWKEKGFAQQRKVRIVLKLSPRALRGIVNPWMDRGEARVLPDGMRELAFECPESQGRFIIPEIMKLGSEAKVVEPVDLAEQIAVELRKMLVHYEP